MIKSVRDIRLIVAGEELRGWDAWDVDSDLLTPADAWRVSMANPGGLQSWSVVPGDAAKLVLDGQLVLRGRVDDVVYTTTSRGARLEVVGRDEFAHLVDCSATPGTHSNVTLVTVARRLTSAWSMDWQVQPGITLRSHRRVKVEPGETPLDVLQRLARKERLLVWYGSDGVAYIGRPDYDQTPTHRIRLRLPAGGTSHNNVMESTVTRSWRGRYQTVTVAGTAGNDATAWGRTSHRRATVTDSGAPSVSRPLIVVDGDLRTMDQAKQRATARVQQQVMDATQAEYVAPGHYGTPYQPAATPTLWTPGVLVDVVDEPAALQQVMLLTGRRFRLDGQGPSTALTLHPVGWLA